MKRYDVGIGEFFSTMEQDSEIKTYALGSCVAVVVWDWEKKLGGLIHIALPESQINPVKAAEKPGYFADSGLPIFLSELKKLGADRKTSWIKLIGGAAILDDKNTFDIGRRNILAVKKYLWKAGLNLKAEETGGEISRTVSLVISSGIVQISNGPNKWTI